MQTAKPISTISYNTEPFLVQTLNALVKAKRIDFWAYIHHFPEDDEVKLKHHFHVYLEPSKRTQTATLKEEFLELDPDNDKPLGVLTFHSSRFTDWYLYALHDEAYLASKYQTRVHHYEGDQVKTMDIDELHARVYDIDLSDITPIKRLKTFQDSGKTFQQAVAQGLVPIQQISSYEKAWDALLATRTDRNGHDNHEVDIETGEVISDD